MNNMPSHYLDVLPAHPRPQPLESLNSYLKRIACANGIHHIATFSHLAGMREPNRWLELTPALEYGQLGTVTCCSDRELLAMTVFFLGRKFGREQSLGRFLAPNLAQHQRWCPECLAEQGYVKLPWSFVHLSGCPQHGIRLLNACPHCQRALHLKSASLLLFHCPHCAGDLRESDAVELTEPQGQQCQRDWDDLAYLLTAQIWDEQFAVMAAFRQRLGFLRRASGMEAKQFAGLLGLRPRILVALENETASGCGETFDDYLRYVQQLGWVLSDVFRDSAAAGYLHKDDLYAEELLRRAQAAIRQLNAACVPVTQKRVGALLAYEPSALRRYAQIHQLLHNEAAIRDQRTREYEEDLCRRMQQVIQVLNAKGERLTKRKVGLLVGHDPKQIQKFYPDAYRLLTDAVTTYQRQKPLRQAQLLRQVERALAEFREREEAITQKTMAQSLGISERQLATYPGVCARIAEQQRQVHEAWLGALKQRIAGELECLTAQAIFISRGKLAQRLSIADHWFEQYPELMALWRAFDDAQRLRRETDLLARTQAAIDACQAQHVPLTLRRIAALLGLSRTALKRYPRVFALLSVHGLVHTNPDAQLLI